MINLLYYLLILNNHSFYFSNEIIKLIKLVNFSRNDYIIAFARVNSTMVNILYENEKSNTLNNLTVSFIQNFADALCKSNISNLMKEIIRCDQPTHSRHSLDYNLNEYLALSDHRCYSNIFKIHSSYDFTIPRDVYTDEKTANSDWGEYYFNSQLYVKQYGELCNHRLVVYHGDESVVNSLKEEINWALEQISHNNIFVSNENAISNIKSFFINLIKTFNGTNLIYMTCFMTAKCNIECGIQEDYEELHNISISEEYKTRILQTIELSRRLIDYQSNPREDSILTSIIADIAAKYR